MEYDVEELEELKRKLNITIPEEEVSKRVNDAVSYTHLTLPTSDLV